MANHGNISTVIVEKSSFATILESSILQLVIPQKLIFNQMAILYNNAMTENHKYNSDDVNFSNFDKFDKSIRQI